MMAASHRWELLHELDVLKWDLSLWLVCNENLPVSFPVSICYRLWENADVWYLEIVVGIVGVVYLGLWRPNFINAI